MIGLPIRVAALIAAMALAIPALAQEQVMAAGGAKTITADAQTFQSLSPRDQKIVHALFEAQRPTATGPAPLNLYQIAALKDKRGWSAAFRQMKAAGLMYARTLGSVVTAYEHSSHLAPASGKGENGTIALSMGNGRVVTANADRGSTAAITTHSRSVGDSNN